MLHSHCISARRFFTPLVAVFLTVIILPTVLLAVDNQPSNRFSLGESFEEKPASEAPKPEEDLFQFNQSEWNRARQTIEEGETTVTTSSPTVVGSTTTVTPPKPPPGIISVELPYESSLSITGRKVIKLDIQNTHISAEAARESGTKQDSQTFNMEQELQARIQGTVARKTTINVNFDDTKENVKDFSVIYKGDPDEVVQEAAFGDIVLSLPSTEFVNYNKQLFGIRTALKYKRAGLMVIGSRTKGTTETKRFTGTTTRQQKFKNDTDYIRRRFYDMTFATASAMRAGGGPFFGVPTEGGILPINGTVPEQVYIEDTTNINPLAQNYLVASPTGTATIGIRMRLLSPGVDYSIDRIRGILAFTNPISEDVRIAVDFTLFNGTRLSSTRAGTIGYLIKDKNPETPEVSQEIKRFYSLGDRNVVRDNGLGNFVFKVLDKNRETEIGNSLSPIQKYPDTIEMKFETGIFELKQPLPFSDIYVTNANASTPLHASFSIEYQSIVRTFTLRPNIVLQSEKVEVNGRRVARDLDYFIDYDIGIITFFNDDLIRESTVIEITYEFAPFGSQLGETLVGARATYDIVTSKPTGTVQMENWNVGSTVLYNFGAKPTGPPDVRSTPSSLLVTEGDTNLKGFKIGNIPVKTNFSLEQARSVNNPNLFGKALIDSMEGIKQEDAAPLLRDNWLPAANPQVVPAGQSGNDTMDFEGRDDNDVNSHLRWHEVDVQTSDQNDGSTQQKALEVRYNLNTSPAASTINEQVSMVNVISIAGRDFSKKTTLEVEIEGSSTTGAGVELEISYGTFNEDADGDGALGTEDQIPFDGILNLGEDIGYLYHSPGPDLTRNTSDDIDFRVGASNGRMDGEDFTNDHVRTTVDFPATLQPLFLLAASRGQTDTNGNTVTDIGFEGRKLFQIPLNINSLSEEEKARLTAVKQVRVTLRNANAGVNKNGTMRIVRLAMVGNTYEPATVSNTVSTMTVKAVNNKDNLGVYTSLAGNPDYNDLYKGATPATDAREQALALEYSLTAGSSGTTRNVFTAPRDFSKHDYFKFFLSKPGGACTIDCGGKVFLQVGSETEFQQATIDISAIPANPNWMVVKIKQSDENHDGTPDTWLSESPDVTITRQGNVPNLTQVSQIKIGVLNDTGVSMTQTRQVWINEIHVTNPHERIGNAKKYAFDSQWTNWFDFGGSFRDVDRDWQTPTTAVTNQDSRQQMMYANFNRLAFLPMTFKTTRDRTITPSAFQSNQNALVSFLEEGRVERISNAATAKLILPRLPVLDAAYNYDNSENTLTQRREANDLLTLGASYAPNVNMDLLPGKLTFRPVPTSITLRYSHQETRLRFSGLDRLNAFNISTAPFTSTNLNQMSDEQEARMAFKPWNGFSFNPTYKLRVDKDERRFRADELAVLPELNGRETLKTPRSISQELGASGSLRILKWLDPRYNYSFKGTETNGLPTQSNTTAYQLKTIQRNSQGELSGAIQMNQVVPSVKFLNSMNLNTSYKLENGDTYNDMPENYSWRGKLWVGKELGVGSSSATTNVARRVDATDRRTFRTNVAWQPFSAYTFNNKRVKPWNTLSLTSNYLISREDSETTGTTRHVDSITWPDLVLTINDTEDFFNIKRVIDNSRLVFKDNKRKTETRNVSRSITDTYGADYQFLLIKKYDISTSYNRTLTRDDNLVTNQLNSKSDTVAYSVQTRIPWKSWAFTPRYERSQTDAFDSIQRTNDLVNDIYSLQIYGDITKPLGIRFGRKEIGLANRFILNSSLKWDKKRSAINPSTNYLDTYSATMSGDYTISQNFRLALGGNFNQEIHHPDFKKLNRTTFGLNATLTIQF